MRLDFNVLWVDDQPDRVTSLIDSIKRDMANEGFEFNPRQCKTHSEMKLAIADNVFTDEVDLILVDWDLGQNIHGEAVIEDIRKIVRYKDVIFYSGQASAQELRQKVFDKQLEGVFCVGRDDLVNEVIGVFESLIKKILDLDHTRGIVMGGTSDIDYMVIECLKLAHGKLNEPHRTNFLTKALNKVEVKIKDLQKIHNKLTAEKNIDNLIKTHMLFTSNDRLILLNRILKTNYKSDYPQGIETIKKYQDEVIHQRNLLGHAVLVPNGKPSAVIKDDGKTVDIAEMRELRKLILKLRSDFRDLLIAMKA